MHRQLHPSFLAQHGRLDYKRLSIILANISAPALARTGDLAFVRSAQLALHSIRLHRYCSLQWHLSFFDFPSVLTLQRLRSTFFVQRSL
jgi:hypothetical protein